METTGGNSCGLFCFYGQLHGLVQKQPINPNPFEVFNHPAFSFVRVVLKDGRTPSLGCR